MIPFKLSPQCNPLGIMQNSPKTGLANQLSACLLWLIELLQEKGASLQVPPPPPSTPHCNGSFPGGNPLEKGTPGAI